MYKSNLNLSLCRTCLVNISQSNVFNIFKTVDLAAKLVACSGLTAEASDEYPENVCSKCYDQILLFYEFQQMCCKSLDTFNKLVNSKRTLEDDNNEGTNQTTLIRETVIKTPSGSPIQKTSDVISDLREEELIEYLPESEDTLEIENNTSKVYEHYEIEVMEMPHIAKNKEKDGESSNDLKKRSNTLVPCLAQCIRCSKSFNTLDRLEAHVRQHDGIAPYICTIEGCGRAFNRRHFYNKHQKEHNLAEGIRFQCDLENCERVYKNKSALNIHKRKFHNIGPELKTHMCEICGKVFKSSSVLNSHHYTHFDKTELPYACEEEGCDKRFSNKEKLKVHKMRHAGIKNFICPHCGMRKTTRNELKIHINYHTLERTWPCRFCTKVCNSAGNLKMHVKNMHERAKDFACRYCERTFAKADTKKYHEMTHTGEKPHKCAECDRRFLQPAALRTHRKIHLRQKGNLKEIEKQKATLETDEEQYASKNNIKTYVTIESIPTEL